VVLRFAPNWPLDGLGASSWQAIRLGSWQAIRLGSWQAIRLGSWQAIRLAVSAENEANGPERRPR